MGQAVSLCEQEASRLLCCGSRSDGSNAKFTDQSSGRPREVFPRVVGTVERLCSGVTAQLSAQAVSSMSVDRSHTLEQQATERDGWTSPRRWAEAQPARPWEHLVLYFDVNKTVLMRDSISGKTADDVVNEVLADAAWGREVDGRWVLVTQKPRLRRPAGKASEDLSSYSEYLERHIDDKKKRSKIIACFTHKGQPGEAFAGHAARLRAGLRNADGSEVKVINAFFELLLFLKQTGRSFTLCFRTFGEDSAEVVEELNAFCEGRHPNFPDACFDGSDGQPDYRLLGSDPKKIGTFHQDDEHLSLVMGTWEQAGEGSFKRVKDRTLGFYDKFPNISIIKGAKCVADYMEDLVSKPGTIALRDYFQFWKASGRTSRGGKVFFIDTLNPRIHSVFFDDNIRFTDVFIVNPVCRHFPSRSLWATPLLHTNLCRSEPYEAIPDPMYFVKQLARLERGRVRSLQIRKRFRVVAKQVHANIKIIRKLLKDFRSLSTEALYDAWENRRFTEDDLPSADLRSDRSGGSNVWDSDRLPFRSHCESGLFGRSNLSSDWSCAGASSTRQGSTTDCDLPSTPEYSPAGALEE